MRLIGIMELVSNLNWMNRMRSPGFEPGLSGWEPDVLTKLDYDRKRLLFWLIFLRFG